MIPGFDALLAESMDEAETRLRAILATEGFGVLADIDIAGTLASKLGVTRPGLRILAVCNPELANRALDIDPSISLLLPCNVVLSEEQHGTRVTAVDPTALLASDELRGVASEAGDRLARVVARLTEHPEASS